MCTLKRKGAALNRRYCVGRAGDRLGQNVPQSLGLPTQYPEYGSQGQTYAGEQECHPDELKGASQAFTVLMVDRLPNN